MVPWQKVAKIITQNIKGDVKLAEPMARHTTWKIGGPAQILAMPEDRESIRFLVEFANEEGFPYFVLGNGSNLLVTDKGFDGLVIKLGTNFADYRVEGNIITVSAGMLLPQLAQKALQYNLAGLEFAAGIPGSLGGAITMNAGAHGGSFHELVECVEILTPEGEFKRFSSEDMDYGYRRSSIKGTKKIVIEAILACREGNPTDIKARMDELKRWRMEKQPLGEPNAGSVFKNPPGFSAGQLIDLAGLKGLTVGGAQVSTKHANFIVNKGYATANDVLEIIERIQHSVHLKSGIELEPEVLVLGTD